jgi:hypothetical protein
VWADDYFSLYRCNSRRINTTSDLRFHLSLPRPRAYFVLYRDQGERIRTASVWKFLRVGGGSSGGALLMAAAG